MYTIVYSEEIPKKYLPRLDDATKKLIRKAINEKLTVNPTHFGKPLQYTLGGYRSMRVGDWRVVFRIASDTNTVHIVAIGHRREVYKVKLVEQY